MGTYTSLKEALAAIAAEPEPVLLRSSGVDWEARDLLGSLSERKLGCRVQFMPGFYIAAVSETGCLGEVLYRIRKRNA